MALIGDTKGPKITNNGGSIWILGLTAKKGNTILQNFNKAHAELIGVEIVASDKAKDRPMFINDNSGLSVTGLRETLTRGNAYPTIVEESRKGSKIKSLYGKDLKHTPNGGVMIPLFTGYAPKLGANEKPQAFIPDEMVIVQPNLLRMKGSALSAFSRRADASASAAFTISAAFSLALAMIAAASFSALSTASFWMRSIRYCKSSAIYIISNDVPKDFG